VISEDGAALSLSLDATISEFLGYDAPAAPAKVYVDGKEQQTTLPIPAIRVRGVQATAEIPDGGTLVLLEAVAKSSVTNKVPMLGDVPLLGKLFQTNSAARNSVSRRFILFATVNLIDPTGNPIHAPNPQDSNGQK
jgi:type II secretory pathway component GspD/PulD (secretin)